MTTGSDFVEILSRLLDSYHEVISQQEGYAPVNEQGDDLQVMLLLNRTGEGDVELTLMSVKDHSSLTSPNDLLGPKHLEDFNKPTIPFSSVVLRRSK